MTELIKWVMVALTFWIALFNFYWGVGLVVFSLPFAARGLNVFGYPISLVSLQVFLLFFALLIRKRKGTDHLFPNVTYTIHIGLFILSLFISSIIWFWRGTPGIVGVEFVGKNDITTGINFITTTISAIMLFIILNKVLHSKVIWLFCVKIFMFGIILLGLVYILTTSFHINLPNFLMPINAIGTTNVIQAISFGDLASQQGRFTGYIGFYENFTEYIIISICLAVILIQNNPQRLNFVLAIIVIGLCLWFGLLSATRSFPVLLLIIFLIYSIIQFQFRTVYKLVLSLLGLTIATMFVFNLSFVQDSFLIDRFTNLQITNSTFSLSLLLSPKDLLYAIGRGEAILYFDLILSASGLFGIAPVFVHYLAGSNIVYHNMYYSVLVTLGWFGLIVLLSFWLRLLKNLVRPLKSKDKTGSLLFSLMVALLIDGVKVTPFRSTPMIMIYWFLFSLVAAYINLFVNGLWNPDVRILNNRGLTKK